MFYVYVDWTTEETPRPFYVGKGSGNRINVSRRNWKHRKTKKEFGIQREIVFESSLEDAALSHERDLIGEFHTFIDDTEYNGIGCNFTQGGDGGKFPSRETRRLIGESNRRRKGEKRSEKAKERMREASKKSHQRRGKWTLSEEHKKHISEGSMGRIVSETTRQKLREATSKMHENSEIKTRILNALRKAVAIIVFEIDPNTYEIINEHQTMKAAAKSAGLTQPYLRKAIRERNEEYMIARTGRIWRKK